VVFAHGGPRGGVLGVGQGRLLEDEVAELVAGGGLTDAEHFGDLGKVDFPVGVQA
jgi:hypothetical protein